MTSSAACQCNRDGSRGGVCSKTSGQCRCHNGIIKRTCDTCIREGFYGPIKSHCRRCACIPEGTMECVKVSIQ